MDAVRRMRCATKALIVAVLEPYSVEDALLFVDAGADYCAATIEEAEAVLRALAGCRGQGGASLH